MTALPFRPDQKLCEFLKKSQFTVSAEIIPPRNGSDQGKVLDQIQRLIQAGAQFLSVTKGAGGSLRGGSLPIAQLIKENFNVPCIAHFTCRDLTPQDVENQLMDHHYFGIRNILALRGDPPDGQSYFSVQPGGYQYAHQLMAQIKALNDGKYLIRSNGPQADSQGQTDFCIGAAVYPDHSNEKERIDFFYEKVSAGAQFAITDLLFSAETYARFLDLCKLRRIEIPILPGTRVLRTLSQARKMIEKFKVKIPSEILNQLKEEENSDLSTELFLKLTEQLKSYGAPGIHLFVIAETTASVKSIECLKEKKLE